MGEKKKVSLTPELEKAALKTYLWNCSLENKVCHGEGGGVCGGHVDVGGAWQSLVTLTHELDGQAVLLKRCHLNTCTRCNTTAC